MKPYTYEPMDSAPRDGTPIIGVCGGVETVICWDDPHIGHMPGGWWHYDDEYMGPSYERVRDEPTCWRRMW